MATVARITLDSKTFQALASSTRLSVLRALDERRKTLTELARDMDLNKATVHEHLQLLTAAGLVRKRDDEGRKWIYYELTWTGEKLLHPQETTTFNVLLGLSVAAAGGGVLMLGRALGLWLATRPPPEDLLASQKVDTTAYDSNQPSDSPPATGTATSGPEPAQGAGMASTGSEGTDAAMLNPEPDGATPDAPDFWDDGGWLSVALLVAALVFTLLAVSLRRHLTPGRFVPPAEGEETDSADGPGTPPSP